MLTDLKHSPEVSIGFDYDSFIGKSILFPLNAAPASASFDMEIIQSDRLSDFLAKSRGFMFL